MSENNSGTIIRASSLPTFMDCPRMWAAKSALDPTTNTAKIFADKGFVFSKKKSNHIGAAMGTALHEGFGYFFQAKIDGYESANVEQISISKFRRTPDLEFDKKVGTLDQETAESQIKRIIEVYLPTAQSLKPKRTEFGLAVLLDAGKDIKMTGHADIQLEDNSIVDLKFGKNLGQYIAQMGAYRIMARSSGQEVSELYAHWVKRSTLKKPQPDLEIIQYDASAAETAAYRVSLSAMEGLEKLKETGDPWSFAANPNSLLCSKTWCPAHPENGSGFCNVGKPSKKDGDEEV